MTNYTGYKDEVQKLSKGIEDLRRITMQTTAMLFFGAGYVAGVVLPQAISLIFG